MKGLVVREANINDYSKVEDIMKQVQKIHVELRPDIYKPMEVVLPKEEFEEYIKQNIFLVAEVAKKMYEKCGFTEKSINMEITAL
ncbi:MAG: hypothetical protein E7214_13185 [Clostridium sp.]|nr:hypothetical protein [Clostridium sp.]